MRKIANSDYSDRPWIPEHDLLEAIIDRALSDLTGRVEDWEYRNAQKFIESHSISEWSFLWIAAHLEFTPFRIKEIRDSAKRAHDERQQKRESRRTRVGALSEISWVYCEQESAVLRQNW